MIPSGPINCNAIEENLHEQQDEVAKNLGDDTLVCGRVRL